MTMSRNEARVIENISKSLGTNKKPMNVTPKDALRYQQSAQTAEETCNTRKNSDGAEKKPCSVRVRLRMRGNQTHSLDSCASSADRNKKGHPALALTQQIVLE